MSLLRRKQKHNKIPFNKENTISPIKKMCYAPYACSPFSEEGTSGATSGSLTVEAALVLSLFLFFAATLLTFFSAMEIHLELHRAAWQVGREASIASGLLQGGESDDGSENSSLFSYLQSGLSTTVIRSRILSLVGTERLDESCIDQGSDGVTVTATFPAEDSQDVVIKLSYRVRIPFLTGKISLLSVSQEVCYRAWSGRILTEEDSSDSTIVYVAENGTVYHTTTSCTHLMLTVRSVDFSAVEQERNSHGAKYYACERCVSGTVSGTVYIAAEGNRYHTTKECSGLKRSYSAVLLSETTLPPCSRCGGN